MAEGEACDTVDTIVVRPDTDTGISGRSEVCPVPHYLAAYADGALPAIRKMAPVILGENPVGPEALTARLDAHLPGHEYAKSAIDIALWDITGKAADMPLHALPGGRRQTSLPLCHSITCVAPDETARMAKNAYRSGIRQFQAKLGADDDRQADVSNGWRKCVRPSATDRLSMETGIAGPLRLTPSGSGGLYAVTMSCSNNRARSSNNALR